MKRGFISRRGEAFDTRSLLIVLSGEHLKRVLSPQGSLTPLWPRTLRKPTYWRRMQGKRRSLPRQRLSKRVIFKAPAFWNS